MRNCRPRWHFCRGALVAQPADEQVSVGDRSQMAEDIKAIIHEVRDTQPLTDRSLVGALSDKVHILDRDAGAEEELVVMQPRLGIPSHFGSGLGHKVYPPIEGP
jgi:hypothetical protein